MARKKQQPSPEFHFSGYASPNFTPIPDQLLDEHLALLTGAELKVVLYVCRRTFGFKRDSDNISLNQMLTGIVKHDGTRLDSGTGLSKSTLLKALKGLTEKNIIIAEQRFSEEKGNEPTNYRLNVQNPLGIKNDLGGSKNNTPLGIKNDLGGDRKLDQALGIKNDPTINSSTKDSSTKDSNNNNGNFGNEFSVVVALTSRGVAKGVAQRFSQQYTDHYIEEKIEYHDFLKVKRPRDIQKPAAWLRKAIEDDYSAPDGFVSAKDRELYLKAQKERSQAVTAAQQLQSQQLEDRQKQRVAQIAFLIEQYEVTEEEIELWQQALNELRLNVQPDIYEAYIAESFLLSIQDGMARIVLKDPKGVDWTKRQLSRLTQRILSAHMGESVEHIEFEHIPELYQLVAE